MWAVPLVNQIKFTHLVSKIWLNQNNSLDTEIGATKFILKTNDDYEQRRKMLNLLSLEQRRFLFDVLFLYKALNDYVNCDLSKCT